MVDDMPDDEATRFLAAHPDATHIDLLISDLNGVIRGKRIPRDNLQKAWQEGIHLPASLFALDISGNTIEETGLGLETGDGDRRCVPVPGTLTLAPWQRTPTGQLLMTMLDTDGSPFEADPRQVLNRVLTRFLARGIRPVVALELEFYLIDLQRDEHGMPLPPCSPLTGERARQSQLYSISELDEYQAFLEDIASAARAQALPLDTALKECAPGQFEINLLHGDNALRACDDAVMLKRLIKGVAINHGFESTFMAKPWGEEAGSGTHVHISLIDSVGNNLMADGDAPLGSQLLHQAAAGMLELMPESMAILAPNLNSYRRFQPELYVPMAPTWGFDNRSVAVRIPAGPPAAKRLEHRVAGADVNVYLLMAVLLASIEYGIHHELTPPAPIEGNAYTSVPPGLPDSWGKALDTWASSTVLREAMGEQFHHVYLTNREAERAQARQAVSALEYEWYLRTV
ncbi:glutamine synthetase family protein [Kushneria phosphatilytica]|nr:glutamine synthetase family protein [Kushneria phosphatilytica]